MRLNISGQDAGDVYEVKARILAMLRLLRLLQVVDRSALGFMPNTFETVRLMNKIDRKKRGLEY